MNLKERRKALKKTQEQIAQMVGVSLLSYQLWERGTTTPTDENMARLMLVLKAGEPIAKGE